MVPSVDCMASLYCAEDVSGSAWDDDERCEYTEVQTVNDFHPAVFLDFPVTDEEAISTLLQKESHYMPEEDYLERYHSRSLNTGARQNAIRWMLKVDNPPPAFALGSDGLCASSKDSPTQCCLTRVDCVLYNQACAFQFVC